MPVLPTGSVTFLFTDVEGSTRLWEEYPEAMRAVLARHDSIVESLTEGNGGQVVRPRGEGDSRFCVFARATDALVAAANIQRALRAEPWPAPITLQVRMALHTGDAELRDGDYYGPDVNRCARLRSVAHGGQVVVSGRTHDLVASHLADGLALRSLGEHRLRDLQRPEHVYQLVAPGIPAEFPALASLSARPNNLPAQLTIFVGREHQLADLKDRMSTARLITLLGPGGAGKTRLALQVAADSIDRFEGGVWFVELAPLSDPGLVQAEIARVIGVRERAGQPLIEALVDAFGSKGRVLILLDNCEHLVAASAEAASRLLRACPALHVLATSPEALGVAGELAWPVPPLELPPADNENELNPETSLDNEAMRLFTERARLAQPAFTLSRQNVQAVARICRRLDGLPLALELAAARVRVLPVAQIATRIEEHTRFLSGDRLATPRQQTLKGLIDWSHDLLDGQERAVFRRLAVFAGGLTLEAAEAVCTGAPAGVDHVDESEVLDLIARLTDKSLLVSEGDDGERRYRLLETIRDYAQERLVEAGERVALRERHSAWCVGVAEQASPHIWGGDQQRTWLDRLEAEMANMRAAFGWCEENRDLASGARLALSLWQFWRVRGFVAEGRRRVDALMAATPLSGDTGGHLSIAAAFLARDHGDFGRSLELSETSLEHFRRTCDRRGMGMALLNMALLHRSPDDPEQDRPLLEEALQHFEAIGDRWGMGSVLIQLGNLAGLRGDLAAAEALLEQALACHRAVGDKRGMAVLLKSLGNSALVRGDRVRALALLEECEACAREVGAWTGLDAEAGVLLARAKGDQARAQALNREALRRLRQAGLNWYVTSRIGAAGVLAVALAQPERGVELIAAAEALRAHSGRFQDYFDRADQEASLLDARAALGQAAFEAALAGGRALTLEEATARALGAEE